MIEHGIEVLKVIFLGIVEGITEWLPISSTGHMLLVDEFLQMNVSEAFKDMFFAVSYTHLDVYKRQVQTLKRSCTCPILPQMQS